MGEALLLFARAAELGRLDGERRSAIGVAVNAIRRRAAEPDAGIWELEPRMWATAGWSAPPGCAPSPVRAFLLCGYWMALAWHQQGARERARAWFERTRAADGAPGLYAEEYDAGQRQLRGNLPQAFVHALAVECGLTISPERAP